MVKSITNATDWTGGGGYTFLYSLWSVDKMPALIGSAYWAVFPPYTERKKKRVGQMIAVVGHRQHADTTLVHTRICCFCGEIWPKLRAALIRPAMHRPSKFMRPIIATASSICVRTVCPLRICSTCG